MSNKIMVTTALPKKTVDMLDDLKKVYGIKKGDIIERGILEVYKTIKKEDMLG